MNWLAAFDSIAEPSTKGAAARALDRIAFGSLVLLVIAAPSVLLIFIFAINLIRSRRAAHFLALALLGSCMVVVAWTRVQKLIGRGVQLSDLSSESPLVPLGVKEGDVIVRADHKRVNSPAEVLALFEGREAIELEMNRLDGVYRIRLQKQALVDGATDEARLGFGAWKRGRGFRAAGFYGHFTTFAEMLQLVGSLAFGLFIAAFMTSAPFRVRSALAVCVGGIVHYNLGDNEVAMTFYVLMALGVSLSLMPGGEYVLIADSRILQPS